MSWEARGVRQYYTRARRVKGRIVREYIGGGLVAQAEAMLDARDRQERQSARQAERRLRESLNAQSAAAVAFCERVDAVMRSTLTAAGYHRHDRGEWRKKRKGEERKGKAMTETQAAARAEISRRKAVRETVGTEAVGGADGVPATVPDTEFERRGIVWHALQGSVAGDCQQDEQALACLKAHPHEFCLQWSSPERALLDMISADSPVMRKMIEQEFQACIKEYAGENPTPLEKLLAERIAVCRMQLAHFERHYAARSEGGLSFEASEHGQKLIDKAQRRYLSAIKSLAVVRRLQLPAVQVNIGEKQVNITR